MFTKGEKMQHTKELQGLEISVPASIANLGPGFDTLAVAVQLYLRVRVCHVSGSSKNDLQFNFVDQQLRGANYIERAFRWMASARKIEFPSMAVEVRSEIPMQAGLGSSAAATVAGLRLFEAVAGPMTSDELLSAACELEGHPDNISAALFGGLTGSCQMSDGTVASVSWDWPESITFLVLTPEIGLETAKSRRALPQEMSRADAVFNLQRVVLFLQALRSGDHHLLREALRDRWHQPFRQPLVPGLEQALMLEHPDLLGVCLSGAGPSIAVMAEKNVEAVAELLSKSYAPLGIPFRVRMLHAHNSKNSNQGRIQDNHGLRSASDVYGGGEAGELLPGRAEGVSHTVGGERPNPPA